MVKHKTGPSLKSHPLSWGVCLIQLFGDQGDSCKLYQHSSSFFFFLKKKKQKQKLHFQCLKREENICETV